MSNTFAWFRKNEKMAFAILTLVAIIAFVVGDAVMSWSRRSDDGGGSRTVTINGKQVSTKEFSERLSAHNAAASFTQGVYQLGGPNRKTQLKAFGPMGQVRQGDFAGRQVYSDEALKQGINFTDEEIVAYLRDLGDDASLDSIAKVKEEVIGDGKRITEAQLFDAIRAELRVQQFFALTKSGFLAPPGQRSAATMPIQEWQNFQRINRRISIEALPFKVSEFEADVKGTPTAKELNDLYEKGKTHLAGNPTSAVDGMVQDKKFAIQFVIVDQGKIEKEEQAKIADADVRKLYDDRVEKKDRSVTEIVPIGESTPEGNKPADKPEGEKPGEKPAEEKPAGDKPEGDKPAEEKPAEEKPAEKPAEEKPADENKQVGAAKKEFFTALQDEPAEKATEKTDEKPADEKPAEKTADEKTADGKPTEEKPAEDKPAEDKPTEDAAVATPAKPKTETRIKPFEEVADELRKELAAPNVGVREEAIFKALQAALKKFVEAEAKYQTAVKKGDPTKLKDSQPKINDFLAPLLKEHELETKAYGAKDQFEIKETELGELSFFDGRQLQRFAAIYRDEFAFETRLHDPSDIMGPEKKRYFWWINSAEPRRLVPPGEADELLKAAWKRSKAFDLAVAHAKELAEKAKGELEKITAKPDRTLAKVFGELPPRADKIFKTPAFSWYDLGNLPFAAGGQLSLTRIEEVEYAGEEFMKSVFAMKLGETGVAYDDGHKHVYVARIVSDGPPMDQLRQDFIDRSPDFFVGAITRNQSQKDFGEWIREFEKQRGLEVGANEGEE